MVQAFEILRRIPLFRSIKVLVKTGESSKNNVIFYHSISKMSTQKLFLVIYELGLDAAIRDHHKA
jgi:hypothetical protein